jgi:hypothetical protein
MGHDPGVGQSPDQVTEVGRTVPAARSPRTIQREGTAETGQSLRESHAGQRDRHHPTSQSRTSRVRHSQMASEPPLLAPRPRPDRALKLTAPTRANLEDRLHTLSPPGTTTTAHRWATTASRKLRRSERVAICIEIHHGALPRTNPTGTPIPVTDAATAPIETRPAASIGALSRARPRRSILGMSRQERVGGRARLSDAALVLRARQDFEALVEALRRDLFDAEACGRMTGRPAGWHWAR